MECGIKFNNGDSPESRSEHAMCSSDNGEKIYIFGGQIRNKAFNDLWEFTISSNSWSKLNSLDGSNGRWGSSLTFYNNKLYLFGGEEVNTNDYVHLFVYDLDQNTWSTPEQTGSAPSMRCNHSANLISIDNGKGILIYAGKCINSSRELADIRVLDLTKLEWFNPYYKVHSSEPEEIPPCRKRHSSIIHNNKMYVFAGWQGNRNTGGNWSDFYILDLEKWIWINPSTRGTAPEARAGHVSAILNDKMFIWGGWGSAGRGHYGELHYIELDDFTWNRYRRGKPPVERFDLTSVLINDELWIFGGQLDPQSKEYTNELWKAKLSLIY